MSSTSSSNTTATEKLQKVLAAAGVASRRQAEVLISEGRIKVNQQVAGLGDRVGPDDVIRLDGHVVNRVAKADEASVQVLVLNKPEGLICSRNDPEGRPTVFDKLPRPASGRWIAVGRLDINTSGLLLLTTDGELANRLMHPSYEIERAYLVRVNGRVNDAMITALQTGVELEDGPAKFDSIQVNPSDSSNQWFMVSLKEGRNREVRRLWESQGVIVSRLKRVSYGTLSLPSRLRSGQWDFLGQKEVSALYKAVSLEPKPVTVLAPKVQERVDRAQRKSAIKAPEKRSKTARERAPRKSYRADDGRHR